MQVLAFDKLKKKFCSSYFFKADQCHEVILEFRFVDNAKVRQDKTFGDPAVCCRQ